MLWPVVAYLVYEQFKNDWRARRVQISTLFCRRRYLDGGPLVKNEFWGPLGGGATNFRRWLIDSPLQFFINVIGVFGFPARVSLFIRPSYSPASMRPACVSNPSPIGDFHLARYRTFLDLYLSTNLSGR